LFQSQAMGGPLISEPYFVGGPSTLIERFQVLRDCGVGVVDMAFGVGTHEQKMASMKTFAEQVLPSVHKM